MTTRYPLASKFEKPKRPSLSVYTLPMVPPCRRSSTMIGWGGTSPLPTRIWPIILPSIWVCPTSVPGRSNHSARKSPRRGLRIMVFTRKREKGPILKKARTGPGKQARLETKLQAKLHGPLTNPTARDTEQPAGDVVLVSRAAGRQFEVSAVEHVESVSVELQVESLGQLEGLRQGQVCLPEARADKCIASQVAGTGKARRGKNRKISLAASGPTIRPRTAAEIAEVGNTAIRTFIPAASQHVITTQVLAVPRVNVRGGAVRSTAAANSFQSWRCGAERFPVGAALELPDPTQSPATQKVSADTPQVLAR